MYVFAFSPSRLDVSGGVPLIRRFAPPRSVKKTCRWHVFSVGHSDYAARRPQFGSPFLLTSFYHFPQGKAKDAEAPAATREARLKRGGRGICHPLAASGTQNHARTAEFSASGKKGVLRTMGSKLIFAYICSATKVGRRRHVSRARQGANPRPAGGRKKIFSESVARKRATLSLFHPLCRETYAPKKGRTTP